MGGLVERLVDDGQARLIEQSDPAEPLLGPSDPSPVEIVNPGGGSPFLLVGDHAGRRIPQTLGSLGLGEDELSRHIGWDIGVGPLGEALAAALDAAFIRQRYSRLVVDCNRDPTAPDAIPPVSDGTPVPGNEGLSDAHKAARLGAIHEPYHRAIGAELAQRRETARQTILVSLHSFEPALRAVGASRPWQIGVLHEGGDTSFAKRLLQVLQDQDGLVVGENEPYSMTGIDYTVPRHAYAAGLPYVELEVRQDLIGALPGVEVWSRLLASALRNALLY